VISGVEYMHEMGICHRDLKLENVLLDSQNNVKIADFGMSVLFEEGQTLKTRCGSPHYMAPEIVQGKKYVPSQTDIWSCGVIFFGMVNGFMPFDGDSDAELFDNIKTGKYELSDDIELSNDCKDLISRMLEPNAEKRITLSEIKEHILMRGQKKEIEILVEEL